MTAAVPARQRESTWPAMCEALECILQYSPISSHTQPLDSWQHSSFNPRLCRRGPSRNCLAEVSDTNSVTEKKKEKENTRLIVTGLKKIQDP